MVPNASCLLIPSRGWDASTCGITGGRPAFNLVKTSTEVQEDVADTGPSARARSELTASIRGERPP
jgi:hypothetical protein